jgi:hypothetical protein
VIPFYGEAVAAHEAAHAAAMQLTERQQQQNERG